jgi:hypothetical protein
MSPERATENVAQHAMTALREGEEAVMSSTHLSLHYQLVFSTKDRRGWIRECWQERTFHSFSLFANGSVRSISRGIAPGKMLDFFRAREVTVETINSKLREIYDIERKSYDRLRSLLTSVSGRQAQWRPGDDMWSIAELAHHLSLSQGRILRAMEIALHGAEERNLGPDTGMESAAHSLDFAAEKTRGKLAANPQLTPEHGRDLEATLREIDAQQAGLEGMLPRMNRDLHQLKFPHLILGELDLYQWILFWGGHASRHRKQMEAITQIPAFRTMEDDLETSARQSSA